MENNQALDNKTNNNVFNLLGKTFLAIIILSVLVGIGFYLGRSNQESVKENIKEPINQTENISLPVLSPTPENSSQKKTITMQIEGQSYSLQAPSDWNYSQEKEEMTTVTKVSDGKSSLIIRTNMATEGAPCGFKDSPLKPSEMFPDVSEFTYSTYTEFKGNQGQLYRRVDITANPSAGKNFFAICEKKETDWMQPTTYGFIMYEIPYSNDPEKTAINTLKELDSMFSSLN